jgi:hypothetical protein
MTQFQIKKATKTQSRLRMALFGPSGSGKTYSALAIAKGLGVGKVAVIDTERGSASKYGDVFDFDVIELDTFSPKVYAEAVRYLGAQGYGVIIIDSLSHAWSGKDGALEMVDRAAKASRSQNTYMAWRDVTPVQNEMVDALLQSPAHIIATMRSKTAYVIEQVERNGKSTSAPRKVGMEPIQRDGLEYEFDVVGEMNQDNDLVITKTRCAALAGQVYSKPNGKVSDILKAWLTDGAPAPAAAPEAKPEPRTYTAEERKTASAVLDFLTANPVPTLTPAHKQAMKDAAESVYADVSQAKSLGDAWRIVNNAALDIVQAPVVEDAGEPAQ